MLRKISEAPSHGQGETENDDVRAYPHGRLLVGTDHGVGTRSLNNIDQSLEVEELRLIQTEPERGIPDVGN